MKFIKTVALTILAILSVCILISPSIQANDWTSFKDHGVYLFHTVPTNSHGDYKPEEAAKLGKQPASHGCIRLSIPDAKYIQTLPTGTPVKIVEK